MTAPIPKHEFTFSKVLSEPMANGAGRSPVRGLANGLCLSVVLWALIIWALV